MKVHFCGFIFSFEIRTFGNLLICDLVLENKVSELSTTIGEYEVQKNEDQLLIRKLRHKLDNLDAEKSALLISVNDVKKDAEKEKAFEPPRISKRHSSYNSQLGKERAISEVTQFGESTKTVA